MNALHDIGARLIQSAKEHDKRATAMEAILQLLEQHEQQTGEEHPAVDYLDRLRVLSLMCADLAGAAGTLLDPATAHAAQQAAALQLSNSLKAIRPPEGPRSSSTDTLLQLAQQVAAKGPSQGPTTGEPPEPTP